MAHESIPLIGAFESTFQPHLDVDVAETSGHTDRWRDDLALLGDLGVSWLRYPIRWHRIEQQQGTLDWDDTDVVLGHIRGLGMRPIVDLVHHTSYPRWLTDGFADARFPHAYLAYVEAFARRYPWVSEYTLFNEPFSTLFLSGNEGIWPPYRKGTHSFVAMLANVLPAVAEASRMYARMLPEARHVWVDTCERHQSEAPGGEEFTQVANDRRFFVLDAFLGRPLDEGRPYVSRALEAGGGVLLEMEPGMIDVLGLDYYAHSQWSFRSETFGRVPSPTPTPLHQLISEYTQRYQYPCILAETNIRGFTTDRASWLKYTLEQCEIARAAGVDVQGYCWFPVVDSCDWDSLLFRCEGNIDPVGVWYLDENMDRRSSAMSEAYASIAAGGVSADLPAYRFQPPVSRWLTGYMPQMEHWRWVEPLTPRESSNCASLSVDPPLSSSSGSPGSDSPLPRRPAGSDRRGEARV